MRFDLLFGILRSRFWLVASIVAITTLMAITGSLLSGVGRSMVNSLAWLRD